MKREDLIKKIGGSKLDFFGNLILISIVLIIGSIFYSIWFDLIIGIKLVFTFSIVFSISSIIHKFMKEVINNEIEKYLKEKSSFKPESKNAEAMDEYKRSKNITRSANL